MTRFDAKIDYYEKYKYKLANEMKSEKMLYVTQNDLCQATGLGPRAIQTWLKKIPSKTVRGINFYKLPDVFATFGRVRGKYSHAALTLLELAQHDEHEHFVGGDSDLPAAEALERFILEYVDGGAERLAQVRVSLFHGLGRSMRSSALMTDAERLRMQIIRHGGCLRYILSNNTSELPTDWPTFSRFFALIHSASPLHTEYLGADEFV